MGVGVDGSPTTIVKTVLADAGFSCERNSWWLERARGRLAVSPWAGRARRRGGRRIRTRARGRMAAMLRTEEGRKRYKERKHLAEPPIGWLKEAMGFRQFSLRGLRKVTGG
ncbi:MAG: transposase [Phycisphaerales bacterium]